MQALKVLSFAFRARHDFKRHDEDSGDANMD